MGLLFGILCFLASLVVVGIIFFFLTLGSESPKTVFWQFENS